MDKESGDEEKVTSKGVIQETERISYWGTVGIVTEYTMENYGNPNERILTGQRALTGLSP